jgi:hypothetical protein
MGNLGSPANARPENFDVFRLFGPQNRKVIVGHRHLGQTRPSVTRHLNIWSKKYSNFPLSHFLIKMLPKKATLRRKLIGMIRHQ